MGAIGHVVARALEGRCELVSVDRTRAPLREGEAPVDAAVVTTKTPGTAWAAGTASRILAPDGVALTVQNGLGNRETLAARLGDARVALGVIYVGARLDPDGSLFTTGPARIEIGRPSAAAASRVEALAALLRDGGIRVAFVDDARHVVWSKVVANAVLNATSALFDAAYGEILANPWHAALCDGIARESAGVARAAGVSIADEAAIAGWRAIASAMTTHRSSMHHDVARGRETEIEALNGAVAREGERVGVPAPLNAAIATLVRALPRA